MTQSPKSAINELDDLAGEINALAEGVQRLLSGRLTERALVTLIYDALPTKMVGKPGIREVLHAAANLRDLYLKKAKNRKGENDAN